MLLFFIHLCNSLVPEGIKANEVIFFFHVFFLSNWFKLIPAVQRSGQSPPSEKVLCSRPPTVQKQEHQPDLHILMHSYYIWMKPGSSSLKSVISITFPFFSNPSQKAFAKLNAINEINSRLMNFSLRFLTGDKSGSFMPDCLP